MQVDVFAGMNEHQREAIATLEGPLLVVAGAGSGKTRVITHRIANIIQHGVRPDRILAITFTNKAAGEMKERVERLIHVKTPWITTFHSAGLRILKLEMMHTGFAHPFTVMDEDDQKRLSKRICKELKIDPKMIDPRKLTWRMSQWKNQMVDIEKVEPNDDLDAWAQKYHRLYAAICLEECLVDFDDLLVKPVQLFEKNEEVRQKYLARFPYILIDEFQDTNQVQYRFIRYLSDHTNICATGDPDQAIYGWRGADIENILNFERDFANCKTVLLEENYRSTQVILRAAQGVVANNTRRKNKTIRTANDEGKPLQLLSVDDEMDESLAVAAAIDRMHKQERKLRDIAVFYRTNAQSRILEDGLRRRGIAYRIVGGTRFYDRREVKDVLAYLKLLVNPRDRISFERIANIPKRGLGDATLELLFQLAEELGKTHYEILEQDELLDRVAVGRAAKPMKDMARTWRMLKKLPLGSPEACVTGVIELTNIEEHYRMTEEPAEANERVANVREMITAAQQYHENNPEGGLPGYLELVALVTDADMAAAQDADVDQVTLMTLHAAKGLEFNYVFITGCEQGVFPLERQGNIADLEEERRLMYVGITRAKKELYLSRARCRMQYGQTFRNEPSQFLSEIPSDCFDARDATGRRPLPSGENVRGTSMAARELEAGSTSKKLVGKAALDAALAMGITSGLDLKEASRREKKAYYDAPEIRSDDPYAPGDRIIHSIFGRGTVAAMKGPSEKRSILIEFDAHGPKELQMSFAAAKLTKGE
jgi:DNA helicase II / ATP-dependent DNA helicase PcrA